MGAEARDARIRKYGHMNTEKIYDVRFSFGVNTAGWNGNIFREVHDPHSYTIYKEAEFSHIAPEIEAEYRD